MEIQMPIAEEDRVMTASLRFLCCPSCREGLELVAFSTNGKVRGGSENPSDPDDVDTGLLKCQCGLAYPIIDGVPRLLENGLESFTEFLGRYEKEIRAKLPVENIPSGQPAVDKQDDYDYIRQSFSREWELFDYASDKTWGWTLEERKSIFLQDLGLAGRQLKGKVLLDAGCGNGTLTAAVSSFGAEIVGIDLNDRLGIANRNKERYATQRSGNVHFVQGNLFNPPLKDGSFDVIYCSGVIHHTPDSKETFNKLVPLVKEGGRLYVWVYGKRPLPVVLFTGLGRRIREVVSPGSLLTICRVLAPFYKLGTQTLDLLGIMKFRKRTVREITLDLFDAFAPRYNHRHKEEEVQGWFQEKEFANIQVSGRQKHGFGVYGDKMPSVGGSR
jgi:ubiquinone/menaquinone biosynthesis C-methylase UbiE/uncharacterized protein YbaR (Trm112 family)